MTLTLPVEVEVPKGRYHLSVYTKEDYKNEVPRVEPLLSEHLDNAFESIEAAFKNDPVSVYVNAGYERTPTERSVYKRFWKSREKRDLKRKIAYTVNAGDAVIISTPPDEDLVKPPLLDRVADSITRSVWNLFLWASRHKEPAKRFRELEYKNKKLLKDELGDRVKSMVYVDLLATTPELQGHGFGSALLNTVLFSADIKGRAVYLTASNPASVPFYESFGFVTVAHYSLGEGNPNWQGQPVIVTLMLRESKIKS